MEPIVGVLETLGGLLLLKRTMIAPTAFVLAVVMLVASVTGGLIHASPIPSDTLAPLLLVSMVYLILRAPRPSRAARCAPAITRQLRRGDPEPPSPRFARRCRDVTRLQVTGGSLVVMFDHVGVAVSDLGASERFYRTVLGALGAEPTHADRALVEWEDWDIGPVDREHPPTHGLHVGFRAADRRAVDAFWQAGIAAGYRDDGRPGPRPVYGPDYYGAFLLDPDGNSVEAVHDDREPLVPPGRIDHLWVRVRDLQASQRFYATIAPHAGLREEPAPGRARFVGPGVSLSLVRDARPPTTNVHIAFAGATDASVRSFHAAALAAGYEDNGGPGERAVYHSGYYGAFVRDPDGHNVEVVNHNR